jgi:FtsP/CotA-like multicopper oxidase with cupredoxin domain
MELSRRDLMKLGLFSSAALALPAERVARTALANANRIPQSQLPQPFTLPFKTPPVLAPDRQTSGHDYYSIVQRQVRAEILPGLQTDVWGYNGLVPGPTIRTMQGRAAVVQQINELPAVHPTLRYNVWTSTHLHGSCSKPQYDGYASDITNTGEWKDYYYPNVQDARTLWYHDHGVHITGPNAYMGLAAMYIMHDPVELALPIPHGAYDVPLILRDAMFESNGQLIWDDNNESSAFGDVILVNGTPWPTMPVERRKYRFRILNGAISRSFDLALDTGEPMTVIATDGGLMPHPVEVSHLKTGMAERYEVVIDFSKYPIGQRVVMQNLQPKNNIDWETTGVVMAFDVVADASDTRNNEIPYDLNPNTHVMGLQEGMEKTTRQMRFDRSGGQWTINGTTWDDVVNSDYQMVLANPQLGDVEIWELHNNSGGWFHPVHIHLVDFKILDRNGLPPEPYERGPKDTVYVGEGEVVRVIMRFEREEGRYMIHCHNLVHEDHDMMGQFLVGKDSPTCDPIRADEPARQPARPVRDRHDDDDDEGDRGNGGGGHGGGGGESSGHGSGGGGSDDRFTASSSGPARAVKPRKKRKAVKKKAVKKKRKVAAKRKPLAKRTGARKPVARRAPSRRTRSRRRTSR